MASAASSNLSIRPLPQKSHSKFSKRKFTCNIGLKSSAGRAATGQGLSLLNDNYPLRHAKVPERHSFCTPHLTSLSPAFSYVLCTSSNSLLKMPASTIIPSFRNLPKMRSRTSINRFEIKFAQIIEYFAPVRESFESVNG